jgi:hypothetical protein
MVLSRQKYLLFATVADTAEAGVKSLESADPFASQREDEKIGDNEEAIEDGVGKEGLSPPAEGKARRMSKEWGMEALPLPRIDHPMTLY